MSAIQFILNSGTTPHSELYVFLKSPTTASIENLQADSIDYIVDAVEQSIS
jgi:hypothetical protein